MPLNFTLKMENGKFYAMYILSQLKYTKKKEKKRETIETRKK